MLTTRVVSGGDGDGGSPYGQTEDLNWVMISMSPKPQKEMSHLLKPPQPFSTVVAAYCTAFLLFLLPPFN